MSGNHTPPVFPYGYYPSSSYIQSRAPAYAWSFPGSQPPLQPSYGAQVNPEAVPGLPENPAGSSTAAGDPTNTGKVKISRHTVPGNPVASGRVSRACEPCREQKAKCSGHQPVCQRCEESGIRCSYGDRKREKLARQLSDLTNQVQGYETLLQDIFPMLDPQLARRVEQYLTKQGSEGDEASGFHHISSTPAASKVANAAYASDLTPSSFGTKDYVDEDFNSDGRLQAMGFTGEHSEIAWLYRLKGEIEQTAGGDPVSLLPKESLAHRSVASVYYFSNESDVHITDDTGIFERSQPVAFRLVEIYFQTVHPCFPIISSKIFVEQVKDFYAAPSGRTGKRWLAILNLVFAIAARYSSLVQGSPGQQLDYKRYFSRARKLNINDTALIDPPNLQQVQVEGLTALYLLSVGEINRSWRMCGISIGSALSMGLNLRNESSNILHVQKEIRYRVWWSLCALDTSLCAISGRPLHKNDDFCTTPLPLPFTEEEFRDEKVSQILSDHHKRNLFMGSLFSKSTADQSPETTPGSITSQHQSSSLKTPTEQLTSSGAATMAPNISLYFLTLVDLMLITRQSIQALYAPEWARKSWTGVEMAISFLNRKADIWLSGVPHALQFREVEGSRDFDRQAISLAFRFYSTKIIILQPCLSRFSRQASGVEMSGAYCNILAGLCVSSACEMLDLLPDQPNSAWLYRLSPWASALHYLMQSATVLLTDLFNREDPESEEAASVIARINKAIRWLHDMSRKDASSRQAWRLCTELLSRYNSVSDMDVDA